MGKTIVIGHKNPDTDSIVASLVAAEFFKKQLKLDAKAYRAGDLNNESKFVLKKFNVTAPILFKKALANDKFILVDHNEASQLADGVDFLQVERILDHHKMKITTETPIACHIEPVGSTSTLLAMMFQSSGKKVPNNLAKLLLAGILSDTLNLTGPTTTEQDKKIVKELNKTAKLNLAAFAREMFAAKSSLQGISVETIVNGDYKMYEMGRFKVGTAVWETTDPAGVAPFKKKIRDFLERKKKAENLDYLLFFVVDILKQNSLLYVLDSAEKGLAEKVFKIGLNVAENELLLTGIVSRKKQIIPPLAAELEKK